MARQPAAPARHAGLRCAVYTRKSSEEGLEQEFNSLDAQREACLAYVTSQRHEGWSALPDHYDDGGVSGGTMERPALQRLLADVQAGRVDIIVVYKVDRLTRSLADFAKIVEILDGRSVSFVSVTQAFNTTTSMGRLTLNVLLSFAQFEREVTGERIRDKIAASKRKGMWMGGQPPLGYDVRDRKLVVNDEEAETVRHIVRRYWDLGSVRQLKAELDAAGIVSKHRTGRGGRPYGGERFSRGALYVLLSNRIYRGEVSHKGSIYPGEHPAIIDEQLWDDVQRVMARNRVEREVHPEREMSLLTGLVYDAAGERLTPTHANKRGTRHRNYVSRSLIEGTAAAGTGQRIPAAGIEAVVTAKPQELLRDPTSLMLARDLDANRQRTLLDAAKSLADELPSLDRVTLRRFILASLARVQVHADRIEMSVGPDRVVAWLDGESDHYRAADPSDDVAGLDEAVTITIRARLKRVGVESRFIVAGEQARLPNPALVRLLAQAHGIRDRVLEDRQVTLEQVAGQQGIGRAWATRLIRLTFLAPDIVTGIMAGRQPPDLTPTSLMSHTRLPLDWAEQRRMLGFGPANPPQHP